MLVSLALKYPYFKRNHSDIKNVLLRILYLNVSFSIQVWNFAGLYTSGFSYPYVFDSSPPDEGIVRDGPAVRQVF